jgi:hypothetical protein
MKAKMIVRGVAMAAVLAFAPGAPAKTLQALLYCGARSTGTTFTTCNGNAVWAHAGGYDNLAVMRCFVRAFSNNTWTTTTTCDASAITQNAELRATGTTFCASAKSPWGVPGGAAGQVCSVNNMVLKPNGLACTNQGTVFSFSNSF